MMTRKHQKAANQNIVGAVWFMQLDMQQGFPLRVLLLWFYAVYNLWGPGLCLTGINLHGTKSLY